MRGYKPRHGTPSAGGGSEGSSRQLLTYVAPTVPYIAVILGLHVMSSGWASILLYHVGVVAILSITKSWHLRHAPKQRLRKGVIIGVLATSALVGPAIYGMWSTVRLDNLSLEHELAGLGLSGGSWLWFVIYYFTVNPLLEETFWRGYLGSPKLGPVWSDVWFAGYHVLVLVLFVEVPWVVVSFAGLFIGAWLWRQITRRLGGLALAVMSHAIADASLIWAAFILAR